MFLEIATSVGAVLGAAAALWMPTNVIAIIFGAVLLLTVAMQFRQKTDYIGVKGSNLAKKLSCLVLILLRMERFRVMNLPMYLGDSR